MNAGRELDALVAEKVFGLVPCTAKCHEQSYPNTYCFAKPESPSDGGDVHLYSTDIASAWEVVGKMVEGWDWWDVRIGYRALSEAKQSEKGWTNWIITVEGPQPDIEILFVAKSPAHAICLAGLKAVGAEVPA